jgi:hypothetical protein
MAKLRGAQQHAVRARRKQMIKLSRRCWSAMTLPLILSLFAADIIEGIPLENFP